MTSRRRAALTCRRALFAVLFAAVYAVALPFSWAVGGREGVEDTLRHARRTYPESRP